MSVLARPYHTVENRLLVALPGMEYERLLPHLEPLSFSFGEVVYESGGHPGYVYFPNDSIISLLASVGNHSTLEVGIVGSEGMVGI